MNVYENLNDRQTDAVKYTDGPLMIVAGPGTGKTKTLVRRAINLIVNKEISPENILIVTFTNKAAKELATRISNSLIEYGVETNMNDLYIGTFHSICLRLLEEFIEYTDINKNYSLMDDFDQQYFIYRNLTKLISVKDSELVSNNISFWVKSERVKKIINTYSEELIDLNSLQNDENNQLKELSKLIENYSNLRVNNNLLDFTTIQVETYLLLLNHPPILDIIQKRFQYIMVDEYQDTNHIQEELLKLISASSNNLCVVGDDDQGLYRFRGATIRNILEFPSKFSGNLKTVKLNINYRSEKNIIDFYEKWMAETETSDFEFNWGNNRFNKNLIANNTQNLTLNHVIKLSGEREKGNTNRNVLNFINQLRTSGQLKDLNQIAFLFKSVKHPRVRALASYLEKNGINVYSPRSDMFFDREEIQTFLGLLLIIFPRYIRRVIDMNREDRKSIHEYYLKCVKTASRVVRKSEPLNNWVKERASSHLNMTTNTDYTFSGLIYQMFQFKSISRYIDVNLSSGLVDTRSARNVSLLIDMLIKFEYLHKVSVLSPKSIDNHLKLLFDKYVRFLYEGGVTEYEDEEETTPKGCVSFLTIHQAKGMEFPITIVDSLYSFPKNQMSNLHRLLIDKGYIRKEYEPIDSIKYYDFWRLYYTAFSRAQNLLVLLADEKQEGHQKEPSKYFKNIYEELSEKTDLNNLKITDVKEDDIKHSYAFTSHLRVYDTCPMQYKFFKELKFKPVRKGSLIYGELIHQTLEDINKKIIHSDKIEDSEVKEIFTDNYQSLSNREHYYLNKNILDNAYQQVYNYIHYNHDWETLYESEIPISLVKEDYILQGKVDLIKSEDDVYQIVDFKTGKKPDLNNDKEKINSTKEQLDAYAHILRDKEGWKINEGIIYYTGKKEGIPQIHHKIDENSLLNSIKKFDSIVRKIENKYFDQRTKDYQICKECDMRYFCNRNRKDDHYE